MNIKPCRPYHAQTVRTTRLAMPDPCSAFKVYYLNIIGRDERSRYEWEFASLQPEPFEALLTKSGLEGVGFITAFPHITKVFRFAPSAETILHVRAFRTADMAPLDLAREGGYLEFACYAEAVIAADEYRQWANARTVADYLAAFSDFADGAVARHTKLAEHVRRNGASGKG